MEGNRASVESSRASNSVTGGGRMTAGSFPARKDGGFRRLLDMEYQTKLEKGLCF